MRIPPWTHEAAVREPELVDAILARRGGKLLNLDRALLWSEPLARAWNVFLGAIRREMAVDGRLREIAIPDAQLHDGDDQPAQQQHRADSDDQRTPPPAEVRVAPSLMPKPSFQATPLSTKL